VHWITENGIVILFCLRNIRRRRSIDVSSIDCWTIFLCCEDTHDHTVFPLLEAFREPSYFYAFYVEGHPLVSGSRAIEGGLKLR